MREIKFRVWDKYCKRWLPTDSYHIFWLNDKICRICIHSPAADLPLDSVILRQYTGMKDRNGKEIYEGDIIEVGFGEHQGALGKMIFEYGCFMLESRHGATFMDTYKSCLYGEIVGNILENPELLK